MSPAVEQAAPPLTMHFGPHEILVNLDVALEWDARQDPEYLDQLEADLQRTSEQCSLCVEG